MQSESACVRDALQVCAQAYDKLWRHDCLSVVFPKNVQIP